MAAHSVALKPYNNSESIVSWEDSDLRKWLNGEFLERNFSYSEKEALIPNSHKALSKGADKVYIPYRDMMVALSKYENLRNYGGWIIP